MHAYHYSKYSGLFLDLDLPAEFRVLLPPGKKEQEINEENLYKVAGAGFPELKTFYQKVDPVAPYATTTLIQQQQQNLLKQRVRDLIMKLP